MLDVARLLCGDLKASDVLRHGKDNGSMPSEFLRFAPEKKPVVVWNVSRRCNLHCLHCYTESKDRHYPDELSHSEGRTLIDQLADFGVPVLLLSGGEPLYRPDTLELARYAASKGLRVVLSTNGTMISADVASDIKEAGVSYVGVSLDGLGQVHDRFRGVVGTFQKSLAAIGHCRDAGVKVGLRFTLTSYNRHQVEEIFHLVEEQGIHRLCFYHLVYAGRGRHQGRAVLAPAESRRLVDLIFRKTQELYQRGWQTEVLTVDNHADAPYLYMKLLREDPVRAEAVHELLQWNGGNNSGIAIGCVDERGNVHPDQFWRDYNLGNVRDRAFGDIWTDTTDPLMAGLRDRKPLLEGRCSDCRFLDICNGNFRVRAQAVHGRVWAPDPGCYLTGQEIASSGLTEAAA